MEKYGTADMGNIDVAEVMVDLMEVMKEKQDHDASRTDHACKRTGLMWRGSWLRSVRISI